MGPLIEEFGWSRTYVTSGAAMGSLVTGALMPLIGVLVDRYGSRRIVLPGLLAGTLCTMAFSLFSQSSFVWFGLWVLHAAVNVTVCQIVWTTAVAGRFKTGQGMAIGLTLAGITASQAIVPVLSVELIDYFCWRMAYVVLGLLLGTPAIILAAFFFFDSRDTQRIEARKNKVVAEIDTAALPGLTMREAARNTALWRISMSIFVIILLTIGFMIHQIEILIGTGITRESAAMLAGLAGATGIVGKIVTGYLLDNYRGNWVSGLTMGAAAVAFAMLVRDIGTFTMLVIVMLVNGYTAGAKMQIASFLTVKYAGIRNFGKIYGIISTLIAVASASGPMLAGAIYDLTGGYQAFLMASVVGLTFSAVLLLTLPRYPDWEQHTATV